MKKEPEILRNIAKEQAEKEVRESHIRNRIGYILGEQWAKNLCHCDIEGFAITEDGLLMLIDECGNCAYCPNDRFTVILDINPTDF